MKALAPNTLLQNRYLVVQLIGKGGMGEVYLAVDQRLGSAVALKRTFFSDDEMLGSAFEREARTLARLRHPVLPKVSDHFTENDTQYLAMEHISGDDLSKRLEITNKPFPLSWVLFWADQLLDALAYLHSYEPPIVHRDIKPQNLKLTDENHIVLLDFGLAKNSIGNTRVTSTGGSIVGYTPHYAPMEQIRGTGTNPRSDLYSLAATAYQLLTNTVPPDALTRADSILNGLPDPTKPLNEVNPEIPKTISDVILKAMSLSMEKRYADAREMQKALREAYAGMQGVMSAQTVAFNTADAQNQSAPQPQQKTEDYPPAAINQSPARNTSQSLPSGDIQFAATPETSAPAAQNFAPPNNFDATMKDDGRAFGIKTEVLPREKMPRPEDYASSPAQEKQFKTDDFSFAPEDDFSDTSEKEFDPNATFPLINLDKVIDSDKGNQPPAAAANFNPSAKTEETYNATQDFAAVETAAPHEENFAPTPVRTEPKKKSGGKSLAVAAGIGGFAVIAVGAAAIGWYALKPTTPVVTATPTPVVESTAAPLATPTVEPTAQPTTEASANTDSSSDAVASDSADDITNTKKTDVSAGDVRQPPERPVQRTPRVISSAANTARRPVSPVKPAPTKPPVKSDRTDILQ